MLRLIYFLLGSGVMNRFHIYSKDLMAMNAKLNKHGKAIYIRWLEVHSRYIIQQWFVGNIPNEKAQVGGICSVRFYEVNNEKIEHTGL